MIVCLPQETGKLPGNLLTDLFDMRSFFAYLRFWYVGQRRRGEHQNWLGVVYIS